MSKVIVITGAGSGLGRALALRLAKDGEQVVLLGRTLSKLQKVADEIGERALAVACDVASPDAVRKAFAAIAERHPKIDVLINNAGIFIPSLVAQASDDLIVRTINTNLTGAILCTRSAIAMMGFGGYIINITSESVELPFAQLALYQASKAGLERFSKSLLRELEDQGVRVTFVRAGQMFGEGSQGLEGVEPEALMAFAQACLERGLNILQRPLSDFPSVTTVIRTLIDLPADIHAEGVMLHARTATPPT
jgi:3-oxoacyl-[acyl-carrier protein] reductase